MEKAKSILWGIILFIPILYLADGVSLVGTFTTNITLTWIFVFGSAAISITLLTLLDRKIQNRPSSQKQQSSYLKYLLLPIIWAIFIVVVNLVLNNLAFLPHSSENVLQSETAQLLKGSLRWPMMLAVCLFGPICEELAFRGVIEHYLSKFFSYWVAVVVTALIFVLLHAEAIIPSLSLFIFAVGLSVLNKNSGTLRTSIIAHITYNVLVTILVMIQL
ncbi:CPBP family intramembrane metalloprotease [Lacticaseibacillus casei]|uniref:Type II CAAX endopeptidase family protein n=1 Tax=Lacticaseibacillus huelsenbergensis TaxID=3035291 RepID=A0ABY8DUN8_9LACO|nr:MULTISPECIES: type II CAAX endopeptidase family protein [Lacticaseibacillus]MDG3062400.1 type II CAAX endopeptidase family protein [Lacticaseibacillus sp. BCRC 81376]QVI36358.1 CPBP family intramembrane metalloprotease [Lacticaseibacillus casei]QXG58157.1 CPBP family intramembrane metalloprotease [Lacticaseibacillus casei]WFB40367.1 type II CAAX endopeptidase family protein [Lacticaseibacillus huelsenbergensis]WFB42120.1 type II CAAX endopeptidase family protein [Lacticaseibacillus huelsenb